MIDEFIFAALVAAALSGCAAQRAKVALDAQDQMLGMSKEQVFACMGPPASKSSEGQTEVWQYQSGNGQTTTVGSGNTTTNASISGNSYSATGRASSFSNGVISSSHRYCTVNVVLSDGRVTKLNYAGPTGGLLTAGEQCAFAVQNCVR